MGKKVKKKARSGQKDKRGSSVTPKTVSEQDSSNAETPVSVEVAVKDRGHCSHVDRGINLEKLSAKLKSSESSKCEDCRGNAVDRRAKKGQGKHGKKGGSNLKSESKAIWICLECGHNSCGGVGLPTKPQTHAIRHSKQNHHPLVVHRDKHQLIWCFPCDKLIPIDNSEDNKHKEVLNEVVKLLKQPVERTSVDVEDVWFGSGTVIKPDYSLSTGANEKAGYSIRGLSNLGNTCFFNSVMQNLLAINCLRDIFFKLDESVGPLSAAMRKLFLEMCGEAGTKGVINPRSLFSSLCIKAPQFRGYQQHDSHELLRCLLDGLAMEELSVRRRTESSHVSLTDPTFVDAIFGGKLSNTVSCLECGHSSTIYEPYLDLSLPVPTKKPSPKKIQAANRGKKPKLPSKRSGMNLSKVSRDAKALPRESSSHQSIAGNSSSEGQSVLSLGEMALTDSADPTYVALDMGLTEGDLSAIQNSEKQPAVQHVGEQSISEDLCAWLDYLEPNPAWLDYLEPNPAWLDYLEPNPAWLDYLEPNPVPHVPDTASETDDNSAVKDSANEDGQHDVPLPATSDSGIGSDGVHGISSHNAKEIDAPEPGEITQVQNPIPQIEHVQNVKPQYNGPDSSLTEEVSPNGANLSHSSESCSQACHKDSNTSLREQENPSQVLDAEIMSCPTREAASSSVEVSSAVVGEEQDVLDFDGFGDMFNEPEVFSGPSERPDSQAGDITKNGVNVNTSESDPDEVDNADAPVSVESCLSFFIKPEFLSKDEQGWECENCSKILRERRIKSRKLQTPVSNFLPNGVEDRNSSGLLDVGKTCSTVKSLNGNLEVGPSDGESVPQKGEICENGKCNLGNGTETETNLSNSQLENAEILAANACHGPPECSTSSSQILDPSHGDCESEKDGFAENNLLSAKCEPEESKQEEVNKEKLKVKRDANRSALLSNVPYILTIHLKRFHQDAKGRLSKLKGHVSFKETIDLKPYMDPRCTEKGTFAYRLIGVVEHQGTMRGGHYVAYVRGAEGYRDGVWYHASDAYVRQASLEEVLRCEAYLLFYERT